MDAGTLYAASGGRWLVLGSRGARIAAAPVVRDRVRIAGDVPVARGWIARTANAVVLAAAGAEIGAVDARLLQRCQRAARQVIETAETVARYAPFRRRRVPPGAVSGR